MFAVPRRGVVDLRNKDRSRLLDTLIHNSMKYLLRKSQGLELHPERKMQRLLYFLNFLLILVYSIDIFMSCWDWTKSLVAVFRKIHVWGKLVIWKICLVFLLWMLRDSKELHGLPHSLYIYLILLLNFPYSDSVPNFLSAWRILLLPVRWEKMVYCKLVKQMKIAAKASFLVLLRFHLLLIDLLAWLHLLTWYTMVTSDIFLSVCLLLNQCRLYHKYVTTQMYLRAKHLED